MIGSILIWLVTSRLGRLVAGVWGVMVILGIAVLKGMSIQKAKEKRQQDKAQKRMENVKINTDRESALKRLKKSGHIRKD